VARVEKVGARPWGIGISNDGKTLFTANGPSNDVSVIDIASFKVTTRIKVGESPWGIAVAK
jgi:YVTN family beta-propeller protein